MAYSQKYLELQQQLQQEVEEENRIRLLLSMAEEIKNLKVDDTLSIATDVIERSGKQNYTEGMGNGLCLRGFCQRVKGEYAAGIESLTEALTIAEKLQHKNMAATAYYYLGTIYRDMGELSKVLANYEKALAINQELGDEYYQAVIMANISNLLFDFNDYDRALEYALKCLPIFEKVNNINSLLNVHNTLGNIYFKKENYTDALGAFEENLKRSGPGTMANAIARSGLGKVYYKLQETEKAQQHLADSLKSSVELKNFEVQTSSHFFLGCLYLDTKDYTNALNHLSAALAVAEEYNRRQDMMVICEQLSELFYQTGDIHKAYSYIKTFEQLKDEIFKQTVFNELNNLQVRQQIELAKKEKEVAERAAELKHKFMANMSHEIRTPMNAIVGMTRLILSKNPRPEHLRYLNAIRMSSDNLLVIINDILDFSKIEAGKVVIERIDFNLPEVMQAIYDMLSTRIDEKGLTLNIDIDPAIPAMLKGDPTKLNQVLINLAGNAIKFTEKGSVSINAILEKENEKELQIRFDVTDTGIGIAEKYIGTIFDSFTQAGSDITRKFGGTGLGLSISKQLANLMGGDIYLKSELNVGSTFSAVITFDRSELTEPEKKNELPDEALVKRLQKLKILLAEDNEFNRMVAEDTLQDLLPGIQVHIAVNGQEAVDKVRNEPFDIVLMDIQMPVMDGLTAAKTIRSTLTGQAREVKIIAMTANVLQEDVKEYLAHGMDAYVAKPFQPNELLMRMKEVMTGVSFLSRMNEAPPAPAASGLPEQLTNMKFITSFTNGNPEKIKKYTNMFLDNAPKLLTQFENALNEKDHVTMKIAAHSLKPQLNYMGVEETWSNIARIEKAAESMEDIAKISDLFKNLQAVCEKAFDELRRFNSN